jgi:hypothetical protein
MNSSPLPPVVSPTPSAGLLGRFGLATLLGIAMLVPVGLTLIYPPWYKLECKRRQLLVFSEIREIHASSFAGFDFLFAKEKWHREKTPPHPGADTFFESIEYHISYPVLFTEWLALAGLGIFAYLRLSKRIFPPITD